MKGMRFLLNIISHNSISFRLEYAMFGSGKHRMSIGKGNEEQMGQLM